MLQTKDSCEFKDRGKMLGALFYELGLRQYPCVAVPLNVPIFHVEIVFNERHQNDQCWSSFIFDEVHYVLQAVERENVVNVRISIQSKKFGAKKYDVSSIVEIIEGADKNGRKAYLYRCSKNIIYIDSHMVESERDLSEKRTVWQRIV